MEVTESRAGGTTTLRIVGRVDGSVSKLLEQRVQDIVSRDEHVIVDLGAMNYVSSAGLRSFIILAKHAKRQAEERSRWSPCRTRSPEIFEISGPARPVRGLRNVMDCRCLRGGLRMPCLRGMEASQRGWRRPSAPRGSLAAAQPAGPDRPTASPGVIILFFGIGPAKISPIYPPAGIAVAATLILRAAHPAGGVHRPVPQRLSAAGACPTRHRRCTCSPISAPASAPILEALIAVAAAAAFHRHLASVRARPRCRRLPPRLLPRRGACLRRDRLALAVGSAASCRTGELAITFVTFFLADAAGIAVFGALVLAWYREPRLDRDIVDRARLPDRASPVLR